MKTEQELKQSIGFKQAFKATLGFYLAQTLMTFIGGVVLIGILIGIYQFLKG